MWWSSLVSAPVRRWALALLLVGAVIFPAAGAGRAPGGCGGGRCLTPEVVRWSRPLPGAWVAEGGVEGTVPRSGLAYAAIGSGIAVVGVGLEVSAFDAGTGTPRWTVTLSGVPVGAAIMSVRAWPGVVTVGVDAGGDSGGVLGGAARREEVVLSAASGRRLRSYPAAMAGGAVSADRRRTVVVGPRSVVSYSNATGKVAWRVRTGRAEQAWRASGGQLYITVSAEGEAGTAPVTAVRQVSLRTGAERLIQPYRGAFTGALVAVAGGSMVFSSAAGLTMYRVGTGELTGQRAGAIFEGVDQTQGVLYADVAGRLVGIDPVTGQNEPGDRVPGPPGGYGVSNGVALGLDPGADGDAWGYNIEDRHIVWTTKSLPWPHYFVDLSGLGGSSDPASGLVLLATCAQTGRAVAAGQPAGAAGAAGQACLRPRLVVIGPRTRP